MEILYKSKNFIIIKKLPGIPSQSDPGGDKDAMTLTSEYLSSLCESPQLFLVHRLDRVVGGALVFARNKRAAADLSALVCGEGFEKEYLAVIEGICDSGVLTDYIYKDSAKGKAFVTDRERSGVKYAELSYRCIQKNEKHSLVKIKLCTGRFHQIRVQFASRKMPLVGDGKYGSHDNACRMPALFATHLAFSCLGEKVDVTVLPDVSKYPWCEFDYKEVIS